MASWTESEFWGKNSDPRCEGAIIDDWFCEHIFLDDPRINERFYFPIDRWIKANVEYEFKNYATCLPQFDPTMKIRELTLRNKRKDYEFLQ